MSRSFEMELINWAIQQDKFDDAFNEIFKMSSRTKAIQVATKKDLEQKLKSLGDQNETSTSTTSA